MPESDAQLIIEQFRAAPVSPRYTSTTLFRCLILSANKARRELLASAAAQGGWETVACGDVETARAHVRRMFLQLAMIDLENPDGLVPCGFRDVAQEVARAKGVLAVVCGHEGDLHEELWARQLGVWLYLPSVTELDDVAMLCGEARQIAERLAQANPQRTRLGVEAGTAYRPG